MGIKIDKLVFSYEDKKIINELSLEADSGESIGIIGTSGCGKSTLLKLIAGLYQPDSGRIEVAGEYDLKKIRTKVAMVMQNAMLLPATIKENITCGHNMSDEWLQDVCEAAQISEWIHSLPDGINHQLGERGNRLSGGQAQRIAIARAIAKNAPVILLDEATSALDADTRNAVLKALEQLTKGKTVIHVTHQTELLFHYDKVYTFEGGKLYEK